MTSYMDQDRLDLSFATTGVSSCLAEPTQKDVVKFKRTIRYLSQSRTRCRKYG